MRYYRTGQIVLIMKPAILIFSVTMVFLLPETSLSYCVEGNCQDGLGTRITSNGGKYVGEFKGWVANGRGTLTYRTDDEKYEGEFKDNWQHGSGILTYDDGYKYIGNWKDGKRHGFGIEIYPGCEDKRGYWVRDMYVGKKKPEEFRVNLE